MAATVDYTALVNSIGSLVGSTTSKIQNYYSESKAINNAIAAGGDVVTQLNRKKQLLELTVAAVEEHIKETGGRDPALDKTTKTVATVGAIGIAAFAMIYLGGKRKK